MDNHQYAGYVVIKTLSLSRNDSEKYKFLPSSWIKVKDNNNNNVVFGYPSENKLVTISRVMEYQPLDKKWPSLYGEVIFDTDSQADAFQFLKNKNKNHCHEYDQSSDEKKEQDAIEAELTTLTDKQRKPMKPSLKNSKRPTKRKKIEQGNTSQSLNHAKSKKNEDEMDEKLELEISKVDELIRNFTTNYDNEQTASLSTSNTSHTTQISDTTEILANETDNATAEMFAKQENTDNQMPKRKSTRQIKKTTLSYFEYSDFEVFDRSDDSDYACLVDNDTLTLKIVEPHNNIKVSDSPRSMEPAKSVPTGVLAINNSLDQNINTNQLNNEINSHCCNFYVGFSASYQKTMSILDNAANYFQNIISAHKDKISSSLPTNEEPNDTNFNSISMQEPSDDDDQDTKWTLKYLEKGPGIIELSPQTGVYVSEHGLIQCKELCTDTTKFARGLLNEVFTDEAIKECSYTGGNRGFNKDTGRPRPALDLKARETLVNYVQQYALEMGWQNTSRQSIITTIKNRLQTLRRK